MKNLSFRICNIMPKKILLVAITVLTGAVACAQSGVQKADALFEAMQLREGSWAADIGSREGDYTRQMSPLVGPTGRIFAVDIDAGALEDLHENIRQDSIQNVTLVYSVHDDPMLPVNALDAVLIRNTFHEFTEPIAMLNHIKAALKAGGRLVMAEPIRDENLDKSREEQADDHDIAIEYAREDLQETGFKIIREVKSFAEDNRGQRYWMIIAERP